MSTSASASSAKPTAKTPKLSKRIVLRLPSHILANFPSAQPARKASRSKPPTVVQTDEATNTGNVAAAAESGVELNSAPALDSLATHTQEPSTNPLKRKGMSVSKAGSATRSASGLDLTTSTKPRGKPGPKKRPRPEGDTTVTAASAATLPHHKLGPKANQGAINAGLRALDRTGKPTRKWQRNGFHIKSFTGVTWHAPSWRAQGARKMGFSGDVKSDSNASSDEAKPGHASSMPSEKSHSGGDMVTTLADVASSPTNLPAMDAAAHS